MAANTPVEKKPIRDLLQEKDAFLTTSEKFYEYFLRHTKAFIAAGVVLAVIIIGAAVYLQQQSAAETKASEAFEAAMALSSDSDAPQKAIAALENVQSTYQGRKAARLAGFTLVRLYMETEDTDKALMTAQNMLQTIQPAEVSLKPMLLNTVGGLSEVKGDFALAADSYSKILELTPLAPELRIEALMALARVQASAGNNEGAIENYEKVVKEFPRTMNAFLANLKVAEITGQPTVLYPGQERETAPAGEKSATATEAAVPALGEPSSDEKSDASAEQGQINGASAAASEEIPTVEDDGDGAQPSLGEGSVPSDEQPASAFDGSAAE